MECRLRAYEKQKCRESVSSGELYLLHDGSRWRYARGEFELAACTSRELGRCRSRGAVRQVSGGGCVGVRARGVSGIWHVHATTTRREAIAAHIRYYAPRSNSGSSRLTYMHTRTPPELTFFVVGFTSPAS